jgi:hypothetical protein
VLSYKNSVTSGCIPSTIWDFGNQTDILGNGLRARAFRYSFFQKAAAPIAISALHGKPAASRRPFAAPRARAGLLAAAGRKLNLTTAPFPLRYNPPPFDFPHSQQPGTCFLPV